MLCLSGSEGCPTVDLARLTATYVILDSITVAAQLYMTHIKPIHKALVIYACKHIQLSLMADPLNRTNEELCIFFTLGAIVARLRSEDLLTKLCVEGGWSVTQYKAKKLPEETRMATCLLAKAVHGIGMVRLPC